MIEDRVRRLAVVLIAVLLGAAVPARGADEWFARDKAEHFAATAALGAGGYALASTATDRERWRIAAGVGSGIGAAAAKELWDRSRGDASWRDFAWGAAGTAAGVTIAWAIDRLRHRHDTGSDKDQEHVAKSKTGIVATEDAKDAARVRKMSLGSCLRRPHGGRPGNEDSLIDRLSPSLGCLRRSFVTSPA